MILRSDKRKGSGRKYRRIDAEALNAGLPALAFAIYMYILGKSNNWEPNAWEIRKRFHVGKTRYYEAIGQIQAAGYLKITPKKAANGKFDGQRYEFRDSTDCPFSEYSATANSAAENSINGYGIQTMEPNNNGTEGQESGSCTTTDRNGSNSCAVGASTRRPLGARSARVSRAAARRAEDTPVQGRSSPLNEVLREEGRRAAFPHDLNEGQVWLCQRFKSSWETSRGAKYTKKDWSAVKVLFDPRDAAKFLKPFFENRVCDAYMADSDHSLTIFCHNFGKIKELYENTAECRSEQDQHSKKIIAEREEQHKRDASECAAEILKDHRSDRWYPWHHNRVNLGYRDGNGDPRALLGTKTWDLLPEKIRDEMLAEWKRRQTLSAGGAA
jgi:hypothetical protein